MKRGWPEASLRPAKEAFDRQLDAIIGNGGLEYRRDERRQTMIQRKAGTVWRRCEHSDFFSSPAYQAKKVVGAPRASQVAVQRRPRMPRRRCCEAHILARLARATDTHSIAAFDCDIGPMVVKQQQAHDCCPDAGEAFAKGQPPEALLLSLRLARQNTAMAIVARVWSPDGILYNLS